MIKAKQGSRTDVERILSVVCIFWGGKWLVIYLKHTGEYTDILGWTSLLTDI